MPASHPRLKGHPASRSEAAALLLDGLAAASPGEVCLIGSLARPQEADAFSDIDIRWTNPPDEASRPCMGVIVTLKALARNRPEAAEALFARALERVAARDVAGDWPLRISTLLDHIARSSPATADLVSRTRQLSRDVFNQ